MPNNLPAVERVDGVVVGDVEDFEVESYGGVMLTPKEVTFVNNYVGPAKFSAQKAWCLTNEVEKDWNATGGKWLRKPHIAEAVKARLEGEGLTAEAALAELKEVALAEWQDFLDVKTRNGEIVSVRMDLASKVRANEIILRAHNRLDNQAAVQNAIVVNINTPGLTEDELA